MQEAQAVEEQLKKVYNRLTMSKELTPKKHIDPFTSSLSEIVGAGQNHNQVKTATKNLRDLEIGIIYDPRLAAGRIMLVLQEKKVHDAGITKRTIHVELFANRFKAISYLTETTVDDILQIQTEDIRAQDEPLEYKKGFPELTIYERDLLATRQMEAEQRIGETEKVPTPEDLKEIRKGLAALTGHFKSERRANRRLSKFFVRQFNS